MKVLFCLLILCNVSGAFAQSDCDYKIVDSVGTTFVVPVYSAKVLYYFDDFEKKAMAQVQWSYDQDATSDCLKAYEARYPGSSLALPELDFPQLEVEVFQGLQRGSISVLPEPGGQFHGQTDFIPVNYGRKEEVLGAIKGKKKLITAHGNLNYQYQMTKRDVVTEFDCLSNGQDKGVIALHSRLNDLILKINSFDPKEKVDRDLVLENFLGACVELTEVETNDLLGLVRKVKLLKKKIPVYGNVKGYQRESTDAFKKFESSYIEY